MTGEFLDNTVRRREPRAIGETGVAVVEVSAPLDSFDFSTAERWELLVLDRGEPVARLGFPSPGELDSAQLARELIWPHAHARWREPPPRPPTATPSCSVVVCTHGRPEHLATALDALAQLDPAPLEVIVVDNAPGEHDCRDVVERRGFRYVREDRKGLDNARNAGVRAARGEVIAFTDDDCVAPTGWLSQLAEGFDDPLVAALTGPAFPYLLDTPARVRMERQASLTRGLRRRVFDWTLISPLHAGQAGVGANMTIRAKLLRAVPEPFPPELDAGTETRSGGDTYVFARLLAAGHRIVYDPRAYVFHQHRAEWATLERAVSGYGTGASAALTKLALEDGELEAPRAALWLVSQYLRTQRRRALGRADAVETRIAWSYVRGALQGPLAWRRALATQRALDPALRPALPFPPPTARRLALPAPRRESAELRVDGAASVSSGSPAISVIVPTVGRGATLARCLAGLATQTLPPTTFEVIVVDDSPARAVELPAHVHLPLRVHRTGGKGAAIARNEGAELARGELLLFLDDDLIATPDLLERHLAHRDEAPADALVIGYSPPRPPRPGLAALGAALWWEDQFRLLEGSAALTFTEALSGNVSIGRAAFLDGRRFDPAFGQLRREDWEWGYRLLATGSALRYEPRAVAAHEYELTAAARIRACRLEGKGDALLLTRHPAAAPFLPLALHRPPSWRHPLRRVAATALGHPRADGVVAPLLDVLERGRLRGAWVGLFGRAQRAAYAHGLRAGGWRPGPASPPLPPAAALHADAATSGTTVDPASTDATSTAAPAGAASTPVAGGASTPAATEATSRLAAPAGSHGEAALRATVLLGPARHPGDDRRRQRLADTGTHVRTLDGPPTTHWSRIVEAAAATQTDLIAIPLPGRAPDPTWLAQIEPIFESPRVALALGQGLPRSTPTEPITLHDRGRGRVPYAPLGGPADYLVLRPAALPALRRAAERAPYGPLAVAFACAEEVLATGALVAHRNVHGLDPTGGAWAPPAERELAKLTAWGSLLADHARRQPGLRGVAWLGAVTTGGVALGARRGLRRRGPSAVPRMNTGLALLRGYVAAIRPRAQTGPR